MSRQFLSLSPAILRSRTAGMWAPHNLLTYSGFQSGATGWAGGQRTITGGQTDSQGGTDAALMEATGVDPYTMKASITIEEGAEYAYEVEVKGVGSAIGKSGRIWWWKAGTADGTAVDAASNLTGDWLTLTATFVCTVGGTIFPRMDLPADVSVVADQALVGRCRVYRTDLGGMQDNPLTGDKYVSTTTTAVAPTRT